MSEVLSKFNCNRMILELQYCEVDNQLIGDKGAKECAKLLQSNTKIKLLNLSATDVSDVGVQDLSLALEENTTLVALYIGNNLIGPLGAKYLAKVLQTNTTLLDINIYNNGIGNEGAQYFIDALKTNTTLVKFAFSANQIQPSMMNKIYHFIDRNKLLRSLQFWSPMQHITFNCKVQILSCLICNSEFIVHLPMRVWIYIFSFWQRKNF